MEIPTLTFKVEYCNNVLSDRLVFFKLLVFLFSDLMRSIIVSLKSDSTILKQQEQLVQVCNLESD